MWPPVGTMNALQNVYDAVTLGDNVRRKLGQMLESSLVQHGINKPRLHCYPMSLQLYESVKWETVPDDIVRCMNQQVICVGDLDMHCFCKYYEVM